MSLSVGPVAVAADETLDEHLVLAYDFEDGQVNGGIVTDLSATGLDGTVVNAAGTVPGRTPGTRALDLTGGPSSSTTAPYVEVPHGLFAGRSQASIATWLKWDGGPDFQWVYNLGRDKDRATFLTPSFQGDARTRSSIKPVNQNAEVGVSGTGKLPTDTWVQAVTTIDGSSIVYYLNGVEVGRTTAALDLAAVMHAESGTTSGFIGKPFWAGHPFFDGAIDDFRVYDTAFDAQQVAGLYDEPPVPLPTIEVDLGQDTGDFLGGASGTLYGLYDEGLPSNNLLDGIKLKSVATKAQDGPQHPGADALEVLKPLVDSSDGDVYIYMTDIHRGFPYQWPGDTPEEKLSTYLDKVRMQAEQVKSLPAEYQDNVVFMPYNEPEGNMFGTGEWSYNRISWRSDPQYFFDAWDRAYATIRDVLPEARIAGPNTSTLYNEVRGFLQHTVEADTVPTAMAWHELSNPATIRTNVARYRSWERDAFAGTSHEGTELPINITEYAYNYHTSVPGQMIQWVSALEDTKAYGDIAYWNIDGNLSDSAVQANRANGQWWLLNAYSQMSGRTVAVTPPRPNVSYTLQGVATLDRAKKQSRVLIGGAAGATTAALTNVPADVFGDRVRVVVREIGWTGQLGDSAQPPTVGEVDLAVTNGSVDVRFDGETLPELNEESAYELVVTPSVQPGAPAVAPTVWEATYEAEDAAHTGTGYTRNGPEGSPSAVAKFYTSGGYNVGGLRSDADFTLDFTVNVPQDGTYDLSVFANSLNTYHLIQEQGPTNVFLRVDGEQPTEQEMFLPLGYKWVVWDHADTSVDLTAGEHVITLASRSLDGSGATVGDAIVDKIDLSLADPGHEADVYEAELAELAGDAVPAYQHAGLSGPGAAEVPAGSTATFWVYSADDAGARITVDTLENGAVDLDANGHALVTNANGEVDAFLRGGINKITVHGKDGLVLDRIRAVATESLPGTTYEAENASVDGTAQAVDLSLASGGSAVTGIGGEPGNGNTVTFGDVTVEEGGRYALTFRYSNEEQSPSTHYNPDPVARYASISINGGAPVRVAFPHSFHENNFWELTVPVDLAAGSNTIKVSGEEKPQFDGETYASDAWPGVPLRSQYAPNLDRVTVSPLSGRVNTLPARAGCGRAVSEPARTAPADLGREVSAGCTTIPTP